MKKKEFIPASNKGLEWIDQEVEMAEGQIESEKNEAPIQIIDSKDLSTTTTKQGLPDGWMRATFIVRESLFEDIKNYAYWERLTIKAVVDAALKQYFNGKKIEARKR